MERLGWAIGAGLVVVLALIAVALLVRRGLRRMPVEVPRKCVEEPAQSEPVAAEPDSVVPEPRPAAVTARAPNDEVSGAADTIDKATWQDLAKLLDGRNNIETRRYGRSLEGRYGHRSGVRLTVAYNNEWCVVVRAASNDAKRVRRVLVHLRKHDVRYGEEDRLPKDQKGPITAEQARDFTADGLSQLKGTGLMDLVTELRQAYRMGGI